MYKIFKTQKSKINKKRGVLDKATVRDCSKGIGWRESAVYRTEDHKIVNI